MKKFAIGEGNEIRGMMIRLYPNKEQEAALQQLQVESRIIWNWLVAQRTTVTEANKAYAKRLGLIAETPPRPDLPEPKTDEEKSAVKAAWKKYNESCKELGHKAYLATKSLPECSYVSFKDLLTHFQVKYDYQLFAKVLRWRLPPNDDGTTATPLSNAFALQALAKNFFSNKHTKSKKRRREDKDMPLQTRSGTCFRTGLFGLRRGKPFYDCQVSLNGLKIRGRLPKRTPSGRVLEGVTIRKEADGWWASIKHEAPLRVLPAPEPGTAVGIDVGLAYSVATSDGLRIKNERGKEYAERIAGRQAQKKDVGRLHLAARRHNMHMVHNLVLKPLAQVETIVVEKLPGNIGQRGSDMVSGMKTTIAMLKQRYGSRVREVPPQYTSQECSQCGHRSKESWSYAHGRYGKCPQCNYSADRDINAARNLVRRYRESLVSCET